MTVVQYNNNGGPDAYGWRTVTMYINTNPNTPYNTGSQVASYGLANHPAGLDIYRATTLLHELGHVYDLVQHVSGTSLFGGSTVDSDSEPIGYNSRLVFNSCFSGMLNVPRI